MPVSLEEGPLKEAAIFTRAVENVFRKLIRLLLGRMTLTKLQEMIRTVYIEEAQGKLRREKPGKNVPLTKLALMTGLDTRTLKKLSDEGSDIKTHEREIRFLRDITPESSVLDYWSTNSRYIDSQTKAPLILNLRGRSPSFEDLVKRINVSRGVTASSVLERLEKSDSVRVNKNNQTVELLSDKFLPFSKKGLSEALEVGFVTIGYLVDTLVHNLEKPEGSNTGFFQRSSWTNRLDQAQQDSFRREIRRYLSSAESGAVDVISCFEKADHEENQLTAGISIFYFEENSVN